MARSHSVRTLLLAAAGLLLAKHLVDAAFVNGRAAGPVAGSLRRSGVALRAEEKEAVSGERIQLKVLSPEGQGIVETVSEVILPSASGQLGVLAGHAPMMTALDTGVLRYKQGGEWKPLVVIGGFATVDANQLSVLVNDFEKPESINGDEAKQQMDEATSALEKAETKKDKLDATAKVKRAAARLQAAMFSKKK